MKFRLTRTRKKRRVQRRGKGDLKRLGAIYRTLQRATVKFKAEEVGTLRSGKNRIPLFFTNRIKGTVDGKKKDFTKNIAAMYQGPRKGIVLTPYSTKQVLKHEIGHYLTEKKLGPKRYKRLTLERKEALADKYGKTVTGLPKKIGKRRFVR